MISNIRKGIPQELLKAFACAVMLLDHIGVLYGVVWLRQVGRMAFPIFCFLVAQGAYHTKNPMKYAGRMLLLALLSEYPYDLFLGTGWSDQSVFFTLFLGLASILSLKLTVPNAVKAFLLVGLALTAQWIRSDFGAMGVLLIFAFHICRTLPRWGYIFSAMICYGLEGNAWAMLSFVPIFCYNGRKYWDSKITQWSFYLFYPVHLLVLYLLK